jgi:hypothetical protein
MLQTHLSGRAGDLWLEGHLSGRALLVTYGCFQLCLGFAPRNSAFSSLLQNVYYKRICK